MIPPPSSPSTKGHESILDEIGPDFRSVAPDIAVAMQAMRRIVQRLRQANRQIVRNAGVSAAQLFILMLLAEREASSLQELAQRTMTDRTSVRDVLRPLLAQNLVERRSAPTDHRRTIIDITEHGRALLARAPEPPTALLVRGLQAMPPADLHQLAMLLEQFVGQMGMANDPASMLFVDDVPRHRSPESR